MKTITTVMAASMMAVSAGAWAEQSCSPVRMADPGWSDIAATNAITGFLLESMGYQVKVDSLAVPITYGGLRDGQVDVFLGNWMPAQQGFYDQFIANGKVVQLAKNLEGTEFTLAVPDYVYNAGVHDFADLSKQADKFDHKIYGIGAGAPANQSLQDIIKKNDFNLGDWKLTESSEQAMLAEVDRAVRRERFIVFLGWQPHPMNVKLKMKYLTGGEKYFGATGSVFTLTRPGYAEACPQVGKLLTQLMFTPEMENTIMADVVDTKKSNTDAAKAWLKAHPEVLDKWLAGVKTVDGKEALAAVKAKL
ncbi:glycine betaine/proline transport system substrate-binding protein [Pseudomonas sp. URIL14HWK12:I9]|nr:MULTISPECIES: choline ABC transporter substrate-binding protein [unclassified Pseudomonas]PVZ10576.1 glycine betaine/proline transport system substrate-binding protein [Pseudomonas sp. URIL14HWK12:I12]PVZ22002.1 glycine betaine/proline transport system substrate-binding protein [Pseudomonas sp. URIL14HWK12:I10]PVZ30915.1 glycine betaine/proline transport system substrate-binding protein [Pseudomonas sp. URIL14HWK12:I11]SNZ17286.1 glycine betaine/proline transport system substrate-binding pro